MSTKNSKKSAILPSLKVGSPDAKSQTFYSRGNSPQRLDPQLELHDLEREKSFNPKSTKRLRAGMAFSSLQLRSISLATQADFRKRGINLLVPDHPMTTTANNTNRREDNTKKVAMWERVSELKASFGRIYESNEVPLVPTKADIRRIINCLEVLTDNDSSLIDLMNIVVKVLKSSLYVNYKLLEPYEDRLYEECDEELRTVLQASRKDGTPYHTLCMALVRELTSDSRTSQKHERYMMEMEKLQNIIDENENMLHDLNADLKERITPNEHVKLVREVETLTKQCNEFEIENQALKQAVNETTEENHILRKQVENETVEIDKNHAMINMLEKARDNVIQETEDSRKQIASMREKIKGFKDILDRIIIKLGNVKQQVLDLRHENEELLYQNERLNLRAGRGFDSLTPRADYRKLIEEKKLDMDIYDSTGRRQLIPTIKIVEELTNRLSAIMDKNKGELSNRRKDKLSLPKPNAMKSTPHSGPKRPSIMLQPPKSRGNNQDQPTLSPSGQKSFFPSPLGNVSPRAAGQSATFQVDPETKMERSTSKQFHDNETEEYPTRNESQVTENDDISRVQTKSNITSLIVRTDTNSKKVKTEDLFGEETIKQANDLINFVVDTKKAIDKFD